MKIAKAGIPKIVVGLIVVAGGFFPGIGIWGYPLIMMGALFTCFCAYFFRDPERPRPTDADKIYSPGDGRVLSVAREGPGDITTIRIFLSIFNVHVQRVPCSGQVEDVRYQDGLFKMAMRPDAHLNERVWMRIKPDGGQPAVVVDQIAGYIARRIECWARTGDHITAGDRYGIIHFGSQVAVHLPKEAKPIVKPGDATVGGITPIAQWTN